MKKMITIFAAAALVLTLTACGDSNTGSTALIGVEGAKEKALSQAGVSQQDAAFSETDLEEKNGITYYQVEFAAQGTEYQYSVDAVTGAIIEEKVKEGETSSKAQTTQSASPAEKTTSSAGTAVTQEQALAKALEHAGLSQDDVTVIKNKQDREDGKQVYEIEFYTKDWKEYDYTISADTGEVLSYDYEAETAISSGSGSTELTKEQARAIALQQVPGAADADIVEFETDMDDGRLEYEGTILYDGIAYEFTIDGYSGAIRSWETESAFD